MQYPTPKQWEWAALMPILAGLYWLLAHHGSGWLFWALLPGSLMLATGVALLLMPGDVRVTGFMAAGGLFGVLFALPLAYSGGFGAALVAALFAAGTFLVAGRVALRAEALHEGAPPPEFDTKMDAKCALDETVLGYFLGTAQIPSGEAAAQMCAEAIQLDGVLKSRGWSEHPETYHQTPPPPERVNVQSARLYGFDYERVSFDSGYVPDPALPGAQLWASYEDNNRATAWVLRHPGPARPWIMCVHGYRMGLPWMDFGLFPPGLLHHKFGLNVVMPILPLHGPRKIGKRTGDYYLDGDLLDLVFAQTQALWDLRRWLAWLRAGEDNASIGAYGVSLGGYNVSLLSSYEADLDFVVAGIPVVDLASALWRVMPTAHLRYLAGKGLDEQRYRDILRAVSPLARKPLVDKERLRIVAAAGDRIVLPSHPVKLSKHWEVPVSWYQGSHLSIRREREPRQVLEAAMTYAGWRIGAYATA